MNTKKAQGQGLVEFALTIPIILLFIAGIIDLGRTLFVYSQLIDATRQSVRYGIMMGLEDTAQYLDCNGIKETAASIPGLVNLSNASIEIFYENSDGTAKMVSDTDLLTCETMTTDLAKTIQHGDVLAVNISGQIRPLTPFLTDLFTLTLEHTSRRTIVTNGTAYTDEWPEQPPAPQNFQASANCGLTDMNGKSPVNFSWTGFSVDVRVVVQIREAITDTVVHQLTHGEVPSGSCAACAEIDTNGGVGMYYMVAVDSSNTTRLVGPPSSFSSVTCGTPPEGAPVTIQGNVWEDKDADGTQDFGIDMGLYMVEVALTKPGDDGNLGTGDDEIVRGFTDSNGDFFFDNLPAGEYDIFVIDNTQTTTGNGEVQLNLPAGTIHIYNVGVTSDAALSMAAAATNPASINGWVWIDGDTPNVYKNASKDPDAQGATVTLISVASGSTVATATTNENGAFVFENVAAGQYKVQVSYLTYTPYAWETNVGPDEVFEVTPGEVFNDIVVRLLLSS